MIWRGKDLKKLRQDRNLTQKALCRLLGLKQTNISLWEQRTEKPIPYYVEKLIEEVFFKVPELRI